MLFLTKISEPEVAKDLLLKILQCQHNEKVCDTSSFARTLSHSLYAALGARLCFGRLGKLCVEALITCFSRLTIGFRSQQFV